MKDKVIETIGDEYFTKNNLIGRDVRDTRKNGNTSNVELVSGNKKLAEPGVSKNESVVKKEDDGLSYFITGAVIGSMI